MSRKATNRSKPAADALLGLDRRVKGRVESQRDDRTDAKRRATTEPSRCNERSQALVFIAEATQNLPWNRGLFDLLLDELNADEEFTALIGPPDHLSPARYPQAVAVAIALRHSWRPDDLRDVVERLGLRLDIIAPHDEPGMRKNVATASVNGPRSSRKRRLRSRSARPRD